MALTTVVSCHKKEEVRYEEPPKVEPAPIVQCFVYQKGKDSIQAQLRIKGEQVSGKLSYSFFEKDKSTGTISGQLKGDTLFALYTFQAEGSQSVSEVVFLKRANKLIEGYADMEEQNGKMVFKDRKNIQFDPKTELLLTPCK